MTSALSEICEKLGIRVRDAKSKAISIRDKFHIRYMRDGVEWTLESASSRRRADYCNGVLNDHEKRNNRPEIFYVVDL